MVSLCDVQRSASGLGGTAGFRAAFREDAVPAPTARQDDPPPPPPPPPPALGPRSDTMSMSSAKAPSLQQARSRGGIRAGNVMSLHPVCVCRHATRCRIQHSR